MGLYTKKIDSGKNQSRTTSLRRNLVSQKDWRLSWGGQGSTGRLFLACKGKCWLKESQASSSACTWCGILAAWRCLCPGKSVLVSAKGSQFRLKDFEQWLSAGESLIVWVTQSEWEQPRVGRRAWRGAGRLSNLRVPWQGEGFDRSELGSSGQGILNSSSMCLALRQGGCLGCRKQQTLLWRERKHLFKSVRIGKYREKMPKKYNAISYYICELFEVKVSASLYSV